MWSSLNTGKLKKARQLYKEKCDYIDTMTELPEEEREYSKEMARAELLLETAKFATEKK